ncbi:hypothetical protein E4U21_001640 [Claviceps maximensis]|nr:hypothetical protein E4U21_001640 [Claviceps maximensis]
MTAVVINVALLAHLGSAYQELQMEQSHHRGTMTAGMNGSSTDSKQMDQPTYFAHLEGRSVLIAHIVMTVVSWVFVLPVGVMLSTVRSNLTFIAQTTFVVLHALAIVFASAYNWQTPDLYPNNSHHKIGWIVTFVVLTQFLIHATGWLAGVAMGRSGRPKQYASQRRPLNFGTGQIQMSPSHHDDERLCRLSIDAEAGTSSETGRLRSSSTPGIGGAALPLRPPPPSSPTSATTLASKAADVVSFQGWKYMVICFRMINRLILPFGFVAITTGIATLGRFFEGQAIFSGLAHWIKGGIFFWLGLFTLGRWSGSFADLGWAWNVGPVVSRRRSWRRPSAEFVESGLIFIYGATNIFLEHLGGWGEEWSPQDLEHLSITVLFIGGGLCGMMTASSIIQDFLYTGAHGGHSSPSPDEHTSEKCHTSGARRIALNPVPALVIFLLGFLMSSHHQFTSTSTMLHRQWGYLLMGASFARGLTYLLLYLRPPSSTLPSRPPTELLVSFGLIAGGLVFMASSSDTIEGMIHHEIDAMVLYTVTVGVALLLMAWEIIVLAIKGWALHREMRSHRMEYI